MPGLVQLVREPGTSSPGTYARRVYQLAAAFVSLFVVSIVGIALLVWRARLFVSLTQRSNVETLTLAFFLVFFAYLALLSARGAAGAARIFYYDGLRRRLTGDRRSVERLKAEALGPPRDEPPYIAVSKLIEHADRPGERLEIAFGDDAGGMGVIVVDGAAITHRPAVHGGSNDLLAYFVHQVAEVVRSRGGAVELETLWWSKIDDEAAQQYLGMTHFARNLERHLGAPELWPKVALTDADRAELVRRLAAVCPALRSEGFLPDWEYQAEHKLPLIPEPLGLISLSRSERRVDPSASMGCAAVIVLGAVVVLGLFVVYPPWVPGV